MTFSQEIEIYIRAKFTLICIVSYEEERIVEQIKQVCHDSKRTLLGWDHADYFQVFAGQVSSTPVAKDSLSALEAIEKMEGEVVFLLLDFHQCLKEARVIRKLRNLSHKLKYTKKTIIITTPMSQLPDELKDDAVLLEYPPPSAAALESILN
ncbi:MAG: AAA family ATPase, partial [bacterium]|nr:AAA family ATPase [bacterium]